MLAALQIPCKPLLARFIMLIGHVSDERYVALPHVLLEFENAGAAFEARSRATGAVYDDLPAGDYPQRGVHWNSQGDIDLQRHQMTEAPPRSGLYYFEARTKSGLFFSFP